MSVTAESLVHSSSSDDFVEFLNAELDSASDVENKEHEEADNGYEDSDFGRYKRQKVDALETMGNRHDSISRGGPGQTSNASLTLDVCTHPGAIGGVCIRCGKKMEDESGVSFGYIHKNLRLANEEIKRLREKDLKNLLRQKKL